MILDFINKLIDIFVLPRDLFSRVGSQKPGPFALKHSVPNFDSVKIQIPSL